ncbi:3-keto-disaccharide hydrolase [Flagellimonas myxillae]|uniref:3-keto-disaccharide hydrolase n=1 Tax=Flagellimonas myxillae TaxID=2942214 RepID=UPI00201F111F|nr:DUF1080 domain-containing protein [Muricauda myxillae]MCL6266475.1 DUF1080 domain-containing protein [Muricauda myxillae]
MKNLIYLSLLSAVFLFTACDSSIKLFRENDHNWLQEGDAKWTFNGNELIGESTEGSSFIMTKNIYGNFELNLEFYPDSTVNSGVFLRCKEHKVDALDCHEINIWDLHPNQDFRTGSVVTKAVPLVKVNTLEQWNTYRIKAQNDSVWVWLNDIKTAEIENKSLKEGYIGLQAAGTGTIKFRNVSLKPVQ